MSGILDLIRDARRPERTVPLCLRGDLVARFEDLERELRQANAAEKADDTFGGSGSAARIAAEMSALREQMKAAEVVFRHRALGPIRSASLLTEHPPRLDEVHADRDRRLGYNPDSLYLAVVRETCYAIDRDGERLQLRDEETNDDLGAMTDEQWSALIGAVSSQQFDRLFGAAWTLDHNDVEVPTSPLASLISQRSGESSSQPSAGESRRGGSRGGSRSGSRSTSTTAKAG